MFDLIQGGDLFKVMDHFDITGDPDRTTIDLNGRRISPILAAAAAGKVRMVEFFASRGAELTETVLHTLNLSAWGSRNSPLAELYGHYARDTYNLKPPVFRKRRLSPAYRCWVDYKMGKRKTTPIHILLANLAPKRSRRGL